MQPWLLLPASFSHKTGPWALRQYTKLVKTKKIKFRPFNKQGIDFENPFGTAGGLDKTGKDLFTWHKWGAGFLEVGTFTPLPQGPNPGTILKRSNSHSAIWNSMGFPNAGYETAKKRVSQFKNKVPQTPLFINIGKNRQTPLEKASQDYVKGLEAFAELADAFVINISSPNTAQLRELHEKENFKSFVSPIIEAAQKQTKLKPILIKISPDLSSEDLKKFVELTLDYPLGGWILTNTTTRRFDQSTFPQHGGVSGSPLTTLSREKLKDLLAVAKDKPERLVVSVGGIMTPDEAQLRLDLGADLIEFYTGLIFNGPHFFQACAQKL